MKKEKKKAKKQSWLSPLLDWLRYEKIKISRDTETTIPSPFSLNLIMQGHYDLIKIEDKIGFLKRVHKAIREKIK